MASNRELYKIACYKILASGINISNLEGINVDRMDNVFNFLQSSTERCIVNNEEPTERDVLAMRFFAETLLPHMLKLDDIAKVVNKNLKQYEYEFILADSEENDDSN